MDERAEIWIARDPETNAESRPVSLRKLRKGVQIARLKPTTLVTRIGANEWVTLERLLSDHALLAARAATPPPPQTEEVESELAEPTPPPPRPLSVAPPPVELIVADAAPTLTLPPVPSSVSPDESTSLTEQWFKEPPPEPGDDEPIFAPKGSLFDVRFERVGSVRLVRLAYVLMLTTLAGAVLISVVRALLALGSADSAQAATSVALVPVVALGCAVVGAVGRMMLEVLLSLSRIADRLSALTRSQGLR